MDRQKKKIHTQFGQIEIANANKLGGMCNGFAISSVLQEMMTYVGQLEVHGTM